MRFAITGLIAPDASASIDQIANAFATALRLELGAAEMACGAKLLVYSPMIVPASLGNVQNESEYRRRQNAIVIFRNIDHAWWMRAPPKERLARYAGALSEGLGDVAEGVLSPSDVRTIRASIDRAAAEVAENLA